MTRNPGGVMLLRMALGAASGIHVLEIARTSSRLSLMMR